MAFGASALAIVGCVGLGTEVGVWYLVRRETQNTADAAAVAGALSASNAIAAGTDAEAAAQAAGIELAATNGFTDGASTSLGTVAVAVNNPPSTGNYATSAGAVEVHVSEVVTPLISSLFGGAAVTVGARSVALVEPIGPVCALALTGDLTVSGTLTAFGCGLASNAGDSTAINITGSLEALTVAAVGGCCGPGSVTLLKPAAAYHPPTTNPYSSADAGSLPSFTSCTTPTPDVSHNINPLPPYETNGNVAYCGLTIDGTTINTVTLQAPGTYFFTGPLTATGGTIQCEGCNGSSGVSIVFLDTGTLNIGPGAVVSTINAAASNTTFPALSGLLFYGRGTGPVSVSLLMPSPLQPAGAFYFPNASLTLTGSVTNPSACLSLIAGTVTLYGTFTLIPSGCATSGTSLAQMQGARLVE